MGDASLTIDKVGPLVSGCHNPENCPKDLKEGPLCAYPPSQLKDALDAQEANGKSMQHNDWLSTSSTCHRRKPFSESTTWGIPLNASTPSKSTRISWRPTACPSQVASHCFVFNGNPHPVTAGLIKN